MLPTLKALRIRKGLSQQKLADVLELTQQAINRYENQNVEPDISTLIKLADFFGTTIDYLVDRQLPSNQQGMISYSLTEKEATLINKYRMLNEKQQNVVAIVADTY